MNGAIQASLLQSPADRAGLPHRPGSENERSGASGSPESEGSCVDWTTWATGTAGGRPQAAGPHGGAPSAAIRRSGCCGGLCCAWLAIAGAIIAGASLLVAVCLVVLGCAAASPRLAHRRERPCGARGGDRQPHLGAQTRALRARDRPGGDRAAAVDGGRVPRRGHRRAHRADRALLGAAGRAHRHGRGVLRAAQARRAAARRRQGGDPRRDPAQARPAHAGGARDRRDPRRGGPPAGARLVLLDPRHGGDDRAQPPGEVGRHAATRAA